MRDRDDTDHEDVTPRERAHERRRDRKRVTRMVVDNAAVRRLQPALRRKKTGDSKQRDADS